MFTNMCLCVYACIYWSRDYENSKISKEFKLSLFDTIIPCVKRKKKAVTKIRHNVELKDKPKDKNKQLTIQLIRVVTSQFSGFASTKYRKRNDLG